MDFKAILLFLEAGENWSRRLGVAARLAETWGTDLTALCSYREPVPAVADCYAIGREATAAVVIHRNEEIGRMIVPVEAAFRAATAKREAHCRWNLLEPYESGQSVAARARAFDLVVLGRADPLDHDASRLAEKIIFTSGAPCLIVPERAEEKAGFARVMVAWNNSGEAKRALQDALPFLKAASQVRLTAIGDKAANDDAEDAILNYLARHGVAAELEHIEGSNADAGSILLHQLSVFDGGLLVMGAYRHSPTTEAILGGATRTILTRTSVPVLISH